MEQKGRINYYSSSKVRNKITGEIGVVESESYSCEGHFYNIIWSSTVERETIKDIGFFDNYEIVSFDYTDIIPQIIDFLKRTPSVERIPQIVARRLDPDYYKLGSIVYFQSPGFMSDYDYNKYGPKYPLIISNIHQNHRNEFEFTLMLSKYNHNMSIKSESDLELLHHDYYVILDLTRFYDNDAYNNLARYDKEY